MIGAARRRYNKRGLRPSTLEGHGRRLGHEPRASHLRMTALASKDALRLVRGTPLPIPPPQAGEGGACGTRVAQRLSPSFRRGDGGVGLVAALERSGDEAGGLHLLDEA